MGVRGRVILTWIPAPQYAAVRVYRRPSSGETGATRVGESAGNSLVDTGVAPGISYLYQLVGVDAAGHEGRPSAEAPARVPAEERRPPRPPTWEGYLPIEDGVGLKWSHREGEEIIAVNVYRRGPGEAEYRLVGSVSGTSFLDRNVGQEGDYRYVLTALDPAFRETPRSEELLVSRRPPAPAEERQAPARWAVRRTRPLLTVSAAAGLPFFRPADVAVGPRTGNVYLSDAGNNRVVVLDRNGGFLRVVGGDPKARVSFRRLLGITVDAAENLYAVDAGDGAVLAVDPRGGLLARHDLAARFPGPTGFIDAAVAPDGRILVVDNRNRRIAVIGGGGRVEVFGTAGGGPAELAAPTFCAVDGEGQLHVADALNAQVAIFDAQGGFQASFGRTGLGAGGFGRPKGVALGPGGEIWVADSWLNAVSIYDAEGRFLAALADEQGRPLDLGSPNGIALDGRGRIFVAERLADRLTILEVLDGAR